MRAALAILLFATTVHAAHAESASTLAALWSLLNRCTRVVMVPDETAGSEITVLFSVRRDGSLQGRPRITYARLTGEADAQQAFVGAALITLARCFPVPMTDDLGGVVAGRPFRLRISG